MALFHQIKRADENERVAKAHDETAKRAYAAKLNALTSLIPADQPKNRPGRKPDPKSKKLLTLRLDPEVIDHFKKTGKGWQGLMNAALRRAAGLTEP